MGQNQIQQYVAIFGFDRWIGADPPLTPDRIHDGKVQLLWGGAQGVEQVKHFVHHLINPRILTVNFVDDQDRAQTQLQRLAQHEFGLWHGPL